MNKNQKKLSVRKRMKIRKDIRKDNIWNELNLYGSEVFASDEIHQAFNQTHHVWSTVGEHTMRVAYSSVMLCHMLRRLHIKVDIPTVVVASLSHDLGILGRDEKYSSNKECHREHPKDSVIVAKKLFDNIPQKTEAIIERHMWPACKSKAPNSIEGMVVSVADKYNAVKDFIKGSEMNHTGMTYYVANRRNKTKLKKASI